MNLYGLTVEQQLTWHREGFLILENFLTPDEVSLYNQRLDQSFETFSASGAVNPASGQLSNVQQICGIIEYDDSFLELMEHAKMMPFIRDMLGDSFVMIDNDGLIKPPQKESHTNCTWPGYEPSEELKEKAETNLRKMLLGMLPWTSDPKAFEKGI